MNTSMQVVHCSRVWNTWLELPEEDPIAHLSHCDLAHWEAGEVGGADTERSLSHVGDWELDLGHLALNLNKDMKEIGSKLTLSLAL